MDGGDYWWHSSLVLPEGSYVRKAIRQACRGRQRQERQHKGSRITPIYRESYEPLVQHTKETSTQSHRHPLNHIDIQYSCHEAIHRYTTLEAIRPTMYTSDRPCWNCTDGEKHVGLNGVDVVGSILGDSGKNPSFLLIIRYYCNHITIASNNGADVLSTPLEAFTSVLVEQACQRCSGISNDDANEMPVI